MELKIIMDNMYQSYQINPKNIIKLEDFNHKSLDEIVELYRSGYILEDSQFPIQQLQGTTLSTISTIAGVFIAGLAAGMITLLLVKKYQKK